jgi:hypothetical protein
MQAKVQNRVKQRAITPRKGYRRSVSGDQVVPRPRYDIKDSRCLGLDSRRPAVGISVVSEREGDRR